MKKILLLAALLTGSVSVGWAADHKIRVSDFEFTPSSVNALAGDTITWVWQNGMHTTTSRDIPPGARQWDKPIDESSRQFRMQVTVAGRYMYGCRFHFAQGMKGIIVVSASPTPTPTATATFTPTPTPTATPTPRPAVLYVATGTFGSQGILYTIDPATGAVLTMVGPLHDAAGNNYDMAGFKYHPITGIFYGVTGGMSPTNPSYLITIDPATALVTPIGPTGDTALTDIAIDPTTGIMYAVSGFNQKFYMINTATGEAVQIGSTGLGFQMGGALATDRTGALFGIDYFSFYSYNKTNGMPTLIGGSGLGNLVRAADFDPSNVFYGVEGGGGIDNTHLRWLVTCDVTTGTCTRVGPIPVNDLDGIAFIPQ